ncbi:protein of unknown function DUF2192 [Pyrolobus fumarii 1A]|uniref:DUF2192 domain-containing protein n=1 Tax=Pyrolobus fumarii (strain DSM 11204 / 1A) TaxID=694429 RepID=G0EF44_PYRF1|nr:DUF2192 domain-containing protein [Pyrolobus fumarii]AEM38941.1 protein of unknown function DUF2192 [Pyrolobus fumarii 1A]
MRGVHKVRVSAAIDILSRLLREHIVDRGTAAETLKAVYDRIGILPIMGAATPPDIYDKELATLYVVARYGLGLDEEEPNWFRALFYKELAYEEAARRIMEGVESREEIEKILGESLDENQVARILRVIATKVLLGYASENELIQLLRKIPEVLPEYEKVARKYARFYIALRVAEAIATSEVKNRIAKEALKQAMAARIGLEKIIPDDEYIALIAHRLFHIPKKRLAKILKLEEEKKASTAQQK